jgi:hypothetical protein
MVAAVVALSDDPGPTNVERYLTASRELEDSRPKLVGRRRSKRETPAYGADLAA